MNNDISKIIEGKIVSQNSQQFIIGVFTIGQILKFTRYTERLIVEFDENNIPKYNPEIQRTVEKSRVEKIADFLINDPLATFPTNLVLGIPTAVIESQTIDGTNIKLELDVKVYSEVERTNGDVYITIIDGQHRIRGVEVAIKRLEDEIKNLNNVLNNSTSTELKQLLNKKIKTLNNLRNLELVVSFFIDPSLEYQAMIFSTINRTQKRVSQNLVNSLFGLDQNDTPQKTALEIVLSLNSHTSSPFFKRVMLYGGSYTKNQSAPISQATMVRSLINLISENSREAENDRHRKRRELIKRKDSSNKFLPFRLYYAEDNDSMISDIMFYYFSAIRSTFINNLGLSYWDLNSTIDLYNILQTTIGYEALLKILCEILEKERPTKNQLIDKDYYSSILARAKSIDFADQRKYPFSTKGKNILYLEMSLLIYPIDIYNSNDNRQKRLNEALGD